MNHNTEYITLTHYQIADICVKQLRQSITANWQDLVGAFGEYVYMLEVDNDYLLLTLPSAIEYELGNGVIILESNRKTLIQKFEKEFLKKR